MIFVPTLKLSPQMGFIPEGSFLMGGKNKNNQEDPIHKVSLATFNISRFEITQTQYEAVMNEKSLIESDECPMVDVCWYEAGLYCNKLSEMSGLQPCYNQSSWECDFAKNGYRLPTEAEWEYACRAGTTTKYYTGDSDSDLDRAGWYGGNSGQLPHPVGEKEPNAFGLYDMHGNVWEWCNDIFSVYSGLGQINPVGPASGSFRAMRGGSWSSDTDSCRSA